MKNFIARILYQQVPNYDFKDLDKKQNALAHKLYKKLYPADVLRKIKNLPDGWLKARSAIKVQLGIRGYSFVELPLGEELPFIFKDHNRAVFALPEDDPFTLEYYAIKEEMNKRTNEWRAVRDQIHSVVNSCNTVKRLYEVWPECRALVEPKLAEAYPGPSPTLAPISTELNNLIFGKKKS